MSSVTPVQIEKRLVELSKEVDSSHNELSDAEMKYHLAKSEHEVGLAKSRLSAPKMSGQKLTVQEREDIAMLECQHLYRNLQIAEALVKAARANANRLRTQVDIARSIGTSVRSSLEL